MKQDVEKLIKMSMKRIEERPSGIKLTHEFFDPIEHTLREKGQESFLWVGIVARELTKTPPRGLKLALNKFPNTPEQLYDRILNNISGSDQGDCERILRWVAFVKEA
jgi:hypothetical protein